MYRISCRYLQQISVMNLLLFVEGERSFAVSDMYKMFDYKKRKTDSLHSNLSLFFQKEDLIPVACLVFFPVFFDPYRAYRNSPLIVFQENIFHYSTNRGHFCFHKGFRQYSCKKAHTPTTAELVGRSE